MGENKMIGLTIFLVGVFSLALSVWVYTKSESSDVQRASARTNDLQSTVKDLETRIHNYGKEFVSLKAKHEALTQNFEKMILDNADVKRHCDSLEAEVDSLQTHCSKLKDQQIELRDKLSSKRPVVQFTSPLVLQVIKGSKKQVQDKLKNVPTTLKKKTSDARQ